MFRVDCTVLYCTVLYCTMQDEYKKQEGSLKVEVKNINDLPSLWYPRYFLCVTVLDQCWALS